MRSPNPMRGDRLGLRGSAIIGLAAVVLWCASASQAQNPQQPQRGFYPGGSYALSDIETVNSTNGDVIFHIPLVSLPPGRGGMGAGVGLYYNSKVYETFSYEDGRFEDGSYSTILRASDSGGWRYGFKYEVQLVQRSEENQPLHSYCGNPADTYIYKLKMKFPDGSEHIFHPSGYTDSQGDNFFRMRPDGWMAGACGQPDSHVIFTGMTYYSADGTFMRLAFAPDGDNDPSNNPWTLSLPDGTRVTGGNGPQRIYDRNNNYVEIRNITYNNHPASEIADQLGRHMVVEYGPPVNPPTEAGRDYIHAWRTENGQPTELVWTIKWRSVAANNHYYINPNDINIGGAMYGPGYSGISEIDLPAQSGGLSYTFGYNVDDPNANGWGELSSMTLPSGAQVRYQYATNSYTGLAVDVLRDYVYQKDLTYQLEYDGTSTPTTETWQYSLTDMACDITAPDGGITHEHFAPTYTDGWNSGLSYKTENPDGSVVERFWQQNIPYGYGSSTPAKANSYVKTEFVSIRNAAGSLVKTAIKDYAFDKNGNLTQEADYDWVNYGDVPRDAGGKPTGAIPGTAQIKRVTVNAYFNQTPGANSTAYDANIYTQGSAPSLRQALASSEVSDGSTNVLSRTELTYDYPLTAGNLIQKTSWDSTKGAYSNPLTTNNSISVSTQYNQYGMPTLVTDARGTQTLITYGYVGGVSDLYPTQIQSAYGTSVQRTATRAYDLTTGLVISATDADNNVTTSTTYDAFGRPKLVKAADGKPEETRTRTDYNDVLRRVIVYSDLNAAGDEKLVAIQHYDQLGRVRLSRQLEDSTTQSATDETTGIKVQTRYLFSGANSYSLSSNPYRAAYSSSASSEGTMGWTRSKSDNTGRVIEVQTFGGSGLPAPWGSNAASTGTVATAYDANFITVTDQAGKLRRSMTNGLGQLARVDEPGDPNTNNSLGTTDSPAQPTSYDYDVLGNPLHVYQGSQTRTFTYSSLARLLTAANPESGTLSYTYDANGNLLTKTDARSIVSTYAYDALNRNYSIIYSNDPANTPAVTRTFDNSTSGAYGIGRLWKTQTAGSSGTLVTIDGYDALGKPLNQRQQFYYNNAWSQSYSISNLTYDRAGHLLSEAYPSGRTITNTFDNAGRLSSFAGTLGDSTNRNYSTGIIYDAASRMTKEQFGTSMPIFNKLFYNSRGQLSEIRESTSYTGPTDTTWNRGAILNQYSTQCSGASCNGTDNNGNLRKQEHWIPDDNGNLSANPTQQFDYDSLNRLQRVYEGATWQQQYSYDRWGNRTINNNSNATWGDGINNVVATIDTNTNRMLATNDPNHTLIDYDQAGNQTKDYLTSNGTRSYDAENRMIQAVNSANQTSVYTYDGDGKRVKRNIAGVETWQVYGLSGELIAEYAANGSTSAPQKEYGYRSGQLLVTVTAGSGTAPTFTDNPVVTGSTVIKAVHITELRDAINQARTRAGLSAVTWTDSSLSGVAIKAVHITELRTKLDEARAALGLSAATYTDASLSGVTAKAIHISELRARVAETVTTTDIRWMVTDQLGTPRMIFDQSGSLANVSRHDYLPFGEEVFAGSRAATLGYTSSDGARQKFTQKERDNETGLDYFGARYFASTQGRFTSADPKLLGLKQVVNPQRWNRYTYVLNNPLALYDPDGQDDDGQGGSKVIDVFIAISSKEMREAKVSVNQNELQKIGDKTGYEVRVHNFDDSTLANVTASLKTADATFVLGHSGPLIGEGGSEGRYIALKDGDLSTGGVMKQDEKNPEGLKRIGDAPEANGNAVGLLGCGTKDLGLVVNPKNDNMNYVTLNGGKDEVTTINGGAKALNALVKGYMKNGVEAGVAAGNAVLRQNGRIDKRDRGDKLERTGAMRETIEIKVPPD